MNPLTWQNPEQLFVAQVLKKIFYNSVAELRFNNSITININAQVELDVDLTIFKKYEKAKSEPSQGWEGLNENYWLMTNKSIIITAKK